MGRQAMEDLNKESFENFDDYEDYDDSGEGFDEFEDNYEGENFGGKSAGSRVHKSKRQIKKTGPAPAAEFNIIIDNTGGSAAVNVELFNYQSSITKYRNPTTNGTVFPVGAGSPFSFRSAAGTGVSQGIYEGVMVSTNGAPTGQDAVFFDVDGNLVYLLGTGALNISCQEIPYRSLFDYSGRGSFRVTRMRMTFATAGQIANTLKHGIKTFLGKFTQQTVSVSSSKCPDQFQALIVDVKKPFRIDAEKGLFYTINAGERVSITMSVAEYVKSAL